MTKRMQTIGTGTAVLLLALALVWQGSGVRAAEPTPDPHHPTPTATAPAPATTSDANHAQHHAGTAEATASTCATQTSADTSGSGMGDQGTMGGTPMPAMGTAGAGMMEEFDLMFIDMMIPHHRAAIAMAQVALERADHEEIRTLAQDVITSQSAEIDQMTAWRAVWYPGAPAMPMDQMGRMMNDMMQGMPSMMGTPGPGMGNMGGMMGMMDAAAEAQTLCNAPAPFDLAFIDAMVPHHQGAVLMAQVALQHAAHPELARLAQQIIDAQQREIGQMQQWRTAWYGATPAS